MPWKEHRVATTSPARLMTAEELLALLDPDDGWRHELVRDADEHGRVSRRT